MDAPETVKAALQTVIDVFCERHPRGFRALAEITRPDFRFKDPFVEIHGFDAYKAFLRESAAHRTRTVWNVLGYSAAGQSGYVRWIYEADYTDGTSIKCDGMTEFGFDQDGRLAFHVDYWDSADAIDVKDPALGKTLRAAKDKMHV